MIRFHLVVYVVIGSLIGYGILWGWVIWGN